MKTQSEGKHRGAQTAVIVDPVRRVRVVVQPGYVSTNPDAGVSEVIEVTGRRIWRMLKNRRAAGGGCILSGSWNGLAGAEPV